MSSTPQLRLLGFQLAPILVFLLVDSLVTDPLWAIGAALVCVAAQTGITWAKERRVDRFILADALLIGGLGAVSLVSKNELFFELKPAIMEAVMIPFVLVLALRADLLTGWLGRYTGGARLDPKVVPLLRRLMLWMAGLVAVHAALVVWAALALSRRSWALISGPGFFLILVPLLGWSLWQRRRLTRQARASRESQAWEELKARRE